MKTLKKLLSLFPCMFLVLSIFSAAYAEGESSIVPVEETEGSAGDGVLEAPVDSPDALRAADETQGVTASGSCGDDLTRTTGSCRHSFDPNGGSVSLPSKTVMYGGTYGELPAPTYPARRFLGWYTVAEGGRLVTGDTPVETTADHSLYANWENARSRCLQPENVTGRPGTEILVPLQLSDNPGLYVISFHLNYDSSVLQLIGVENGTLSGWICSTYSDYVRWDAPEERDESADGKVVSFRFQISETAADGETLISLDDFLAMNREGEEIPFQLLPGSVTVSRRIAGDVNGDGEVCILDLVRLRKYLMHDTQDIQSANADVTGDGIVDNQDLIRLRKFLVGDPFAVLS